MSMMCPPHRVKMVSTPSFFSALATRCPPEMTSALRLFRLRVSSAVVVPRLSVVLVAVSSMDASIRNNCPRRYGSRGSGVRTRRPSASGGRARSHPSARRQLRRGTNGGGPIRVRAAHGLQDHDGHQRREDVECGGGDEYPVPISLRGDHDVGQWYQQRGRALRGVHETGVGRRVRAAKSVRDGSREEAVDLTPGEEHQTAQQDERHRVVAEIGERDDARAFDQEGDEHGLLTPDVVGHPTEEWPGQTVQYAVDAQGEGQRRERYADQAHRNLRDLEVLGDGRELTFALSIDRILNGLTRPFFGWV